MAWTDEAFFHIQVNRFVFSVDAKDFALNQLQVLYVNVNEKINHVSMGLHCITQRNHGIVAFCCSSLRKHLIIIAPCINPTTWLSISSAHFLHNVQFYNSLEKSRTNIYANEAAVQCDLWLQLAVNTGDNCLFIPNVSVINRTTPWRHTG